MERNGQLLRFALCLFKIKIECNVMASPFGFGWFWTKRERERAERKSFSFYGADLARGGCVIFGPSSFVTEIVAPSPESQSPAPRPKFFFGKVRHILAFCCMYYQYHTIRYQYRVHFSSFKYTYLQYCTATPDCIS